MRILFITCAPKLPCMYKLPISLICLLFACQSNLFSQSIPNYRSPSNPQYWKNRKPYPDYWQQDIQYKIKARLNEKTNIVSATEELTYYNNSPDVLTFVYFHLYQNAFQPGSYLDNLNKNNKVKPKYGHYEAFKECTVVEKMSDESGDLKTELDNTIMKVYLSKPLKSGDSVKFNIAFKSYFDNGSIRRRMKMFNAYGYKHYDCVHWYPRISVYDSKFGWTTDQHLGKEFYGDFGSFDVELNMPNNYIVEATGELQNPKEALPDSLRKKLAIANFKNKPLEEAPSVIIPYDTSIRRTWIYHADNVHDFAFTADPTYRIGEAEWNGIKCIAVAQEPHAAKWQNAADYTAKIIKTYSENIGMYVYPKMVVADARDGMEYPMLTLDGGLDPDYRSLLAHEVGHNWFFGQVGNNETYRAALDEGFTQFLNSFALETIDTTIMITDPPKSFWLREFKKPDLVRDRVVYNAYMYSAMQADPSTLNTHSDDFNGALGHGGGYRNVYFKTATMLYNLQYVLGDELFWKAFRNYFSQWKIAHPYFEDFRNSIIQYTKVDLNWFFDEWLETSKRLDYGIKCISKGRKQDEYIIKFVRKEKMQMPIDFSVYSKDSTKYDFHIPNDWFVKKTTATVLPKWFGWDKIQPTYNATVTIPKGIQNVVIDTSNRLADFYMLDNSSRMPLIYDLDAQVYNTPDWKTYRFLARPDVWFNNYDGIKAGVHFSGDYLQYFHVFSASVWFNTGYVQQPMGEKTNLNRFDDFSFTFNYKTSLNRISKDAFVNFSAKSLDGLRALNIGLEKLLPEKNNRLYLNVKAMYRPDSNALGYLLYPKEWNAGKYNNTVNVGMEHNYGYDKGNGNIVLNLKSSTIGSSYGYSQLSLTVINKNNLGYIGINTRTFLQYGTGGNVAPESALFLAGANPEEIMENKFTRSRAFVDYDWLGYGETTNHFQQGGGLNLRGYAGYLVPYMDKNGNIHTIYKGNSGAAFNIELEFDKLAGIHPKFTKNWLELKTYLFGDAGIINYNNPGTALTLADFRMDAGIGTALTIKKWGPLQMAKPLTIRFDMPLFLNRTPAIEPEYLKFRWVVGINRAF